MSAARFLAAAVRGAARRPLAVIAAATVLSLAGGALALGLDPTAGTDTLVGKGSESYAATAEFHERFGDDAVIVLVRGKLTDTVLSQDIERLLGLEGCIAGRPPRGVTPKGGPNGPCARFARTKPAKGVYGPGTFINEAVGQLADQFEKQSAEKTAQAKRAYDAAYRLARAQGRSKSASRRLGKQAQDLVFAEFTRTVLQLAVRYGLKSVPRLNDPDFVSGLVFDPAKPVGTPKARFAYLFPTRQSALVQIRLRPELTDAQRNEAIELVRAAVRMPEWRPRHGQTYVVTGAPVVVSQLTDSITDSIVLLLIAALVVMALTLAVVFRNRLRLLPLALALAAAALVFGGLALTGGSLTMASIAVLPVLIGLAVDYAIQFQSRFREAERDSGGSPETIAQRAAMLGAPTIATAAAATTAGFLVLLLSPVPMVRGFGLLLVIGIVVAFALALTVGSAVLVRASGASRGAALVPRRGARARNAARAAGDALSASWRGAGELVARNRAGRAVAGRARRTASASLAAALRRPGRVLAVAVVLAAAGWALDTQTDVESDVQKLVPQDLGALRDLRALQESTGVGGEIDVLVRAPDLTQPAVVKWMASYQDELLKRYGYTTTRGCGRATLCPAFSLPTLFGTQVSKLRQADVRALLDAMPAYFSQAVITSDRQLATLAFGIRLMPLDKQQEVIEDMRRRLDPPPGVTARLAGLPVLAAEANEQVASPWRRLLTLLAGLLAVALVLLVALRRPARALVPLIPIALATGWSALILFAIRIPLNPMSVTLGALVIAISTEFSVLLSERYRQERAAGHAPRDALARTYSSTGAAVLASGATAIAGFAVLVLSDIRMLRDFGFVTVIDLTVALVGVALVLPAVLMLAERGDVLASVRSRARLPRRPRRAAAS